MENDIIKDIEEALRSSVEVDYSPTLRSDMPISSPTPQSNRPNSPPVSQSPRETSTPANNPPTRLITNASGQPKKAPPVAPPPVNDTYNDTYDDQNTIVRRKPKGAPSKKDTDISQDTKVRRKPRKESPDGVAPTNRKDDDHELDMGSPDFDVKFDFDGVYRDVPVDKPFRLRRERRTGLVGGVLFGLFVICISLILASLAWAATTDILGFASEDVEVAVQVPQDFTLDGVADMLYESGLIRQRALFVWYAEFSNAMDRINPGSFILNKNYDYRALVQGMTARAGTRVETTVTIPEGFTLAQIFILLEREEVAVADDLWYIATYHDFDFHFLDSSTVGERLRLEGFLFPETYNFYKNSSATVVIRRMLREFNRRFTEEYVERAEDMGLTVHEIVIIASMIEREAGNDAERPRIAAVIYNRLASPDFPFLQIDATIDYYIAGRGIPWSRHLDTPFNSYTHPGLPPGAIANPGISSIRAALFPDSTNEFFYALNNYGTHNFFTNYTDHHNFVQSDEFGGRGGG